MRPASRSQNGRPDLPGQDSADRCPDGAGRVRREEPAVRDGCGLHWPWIRTGWSWPPPLLVKSRRHASIDCTRCVDGSVAPSRRRAPLLRLAPPQRLPGLAPAVVLVTTLRSVRRRRSIQVPTARCCRWRYMTRWWIERPQQLPPALAATSVHLRLPNRWA